MVVYTYVDFKDIKEKLVITTLESRKCIEWGRKFQQLMVD